MSVDSAIQTFKLAKEFNGLVAVNGIDLEIKRGELFSLLGPNGAGKTTTINMLCCLLKPTGGTASVMGYDIAKEPFKVKELIGVSPQETVVSEHLNCWENLSLMGKVHGMESKELKKRSGKLLETKFSERCSVMFMIQSDKGKVLPLRYGNPRRSMRLFRIWLLLVRKQATSIKCF